MNVSLQQLNEKQADVLLRALELYARLGIGQIDALENIPFFMEKDASWEEKAKAFEEVRKVLFPELSPNQSHGIRSEKTPEESKIAWDMYQVLRHDLSWFNNPEGGSSVHYQNPSQASSQQLCSCKIEK